MLYKCDKSTNYITKKQEKTIFLLARLFHHQVQFFRLLSDRINLLVFQSLILSVVLRPLLKSETQAPLLLEPFYFSPLLLTNLPICQFVLSVVLRLPVWLSPTCVLILSYLCFCIATLPFHSMDFPKISDFPKAESSQ